MTVQFIIVGALLSLLTACGEKNKPSTTPPKVDTPPTPLPHPSHVSPLTILEKDLDINTTNLAVNEKQTALRKQEWDHWKKEASNVTLSAVDRKIAEEHAIAAKKSWDDSRFQKEQLLLEKETLQRKIDSLKADAAQAN